MLSTGIVGMQHAAAERMSKVRDYQCS